MCLLLCLCTCVCVCVSMSGHTHSWKKQSVVLLAYEDSRPHPCATGAPATLPEDACRGSRQWGWVSREQ